MTHPIPSSAVDLSLCHKVQFQSFGDERGQLVALEGQRHVPFNIQRVYYIYDTLPGVVRGKHAHVELEQVLIAIAGSCKILLDNGSEQDFVELNTPTEGLYIKGMIWREMLDFSEDCVLMVLASQPYDESDYIRDYNTFLERLSV